MPRLLSLFARWCTMLIEGQLTDVQKRVRDNSVDPIKLAKELWPHVYFYREQRQIIYSVWDNDQTVVPAGNMLGKDFVAGFIAVAFFLTRYPCRIVTTSAKDDHLRVLWGEIGRYIQTCKYSLDMRKGGPLLINHQNIRKVLNGEVCPISYIIGMVASEQTEAAMQGHHCNLTAAQIAEGMDPWVPRTLFIADECSSVPDSYWKLAGTWAKRMLAIGNPWPCENFFKFAVKGRPGTEDKGGDLLRPRGAGFIRKVIKIRAIDSPNIRYALAQKAKGLEPTGIIDGKPLVPGVKDWDEYQKNLLTWDEVQKSVSLDAEFYEGAEVKLFPGNWLTYSEERARELQQSRIKRIPKAMGIDPAEGGDKSAWCIIDEYGVLDLVSMKTPDTNDVVRQTLALMFKHNLKGEAVCFDRGGGGKEHADRLRSMGHHVRTVGFGESVAPDPRRGNFSTKFKVDEKEQRYAYVNRRAEMYGELSEVLNPTARQGQSFAIPSWYPAFRAQLGPIPKKYNAEGRLELPPKNKKDNAGPKVICLIDLIGHSPDEADALVLAYHCMTHKPPIRQVGAV